MDPFFCLIQLDPGLPLGPLCLHRGLSFAQRGGNIQTWETKWATGAFCRKVDIEECRLDMGLEVWRRRRMVGGDPGVSGHRQMCDAQMAEMVSTSR